MQIGPLSRPQIFRDTDRAFEIPAVLVYPILDIAVEVDIFLLNERLQSL
jgi:hypothetical protein